MLIELLAALAIPIAGAWLCLLCYLRGMRFGVRMSVEAAYKQAGLIDSPIPDIRVQYVNEIVSAALARKNGHLKYGDAYHTWRRKGGLPDSPTVRALWMDEDFRKATGG